MIRKKLVLVIFGVILSFFILELGLRFSGYLISFSQDYRNNQSLRKKTEYKILCLGESTTALGGIYAYPYQLEDVLNKKNSGVKFSVINKGTSAVTTGAILGVVEQLIEKYNPDMVITMIGINDLNIPSYLRPKKEGKKKHVLKQLKLYKLFCLIKDHLSSNFKKDNDYVNINDEREKGLSLKTDDFVEKTGSLSSDIIDIRKMGKESKEIAGNEKSISDYNEMVNYCLNDKKYKKAEGILKEAISFYPDINEFYFDLAKIYQLLGQYLKAKNILEKIKLSSDLNDEALIVLGICYRNLCLYDKAKKVLKKAIKLYPQNLSAYIALGEVYNDIGENEKALKMFNFANGIENKDKINSSYYYLVKARTYWNEKSYLSAEKNFKKAIELNPNDSGLYVRLATFYIDLKKYEEAINVLKSAIDINGQDKHAYVWLLRAYFDKAEWDKIKQLCDDSLNSDYASDEFCNVCAESYIKDKNFLKAEQMLKEAIKLKPFEDANYSALGEYYQSQGEYEKAELIYQEAIRKKSASRYDQGVEMVDTSKKYGRLGKSESAKIVYEKEIKQYPKLADGYIELARWYRGFGEYNEAINILEKYIKLADKPDDIVYGLLWQLSQDINNKDKVVKYYNKIKNRNKKMYTQETKDNYRKIKNIVNSKNIPLICVQYPRRDINVLKKIFDDYFGVIFVDNQALFNEAVEAKGYDYYFTDSFAGDFGHCTREGNRLLAENIANILCKTVLKSICSD